MKKRPILFSLAICLLTVSIMVTYFTMYSSVHGFDLFLNHAFSWGNEETPNPTASNMPGNTPDATTSTPAPTVQPTVTPNPTPTPIPEPTYTDVTLAFIGDFLMHDNVLKAHYDSETKNYDFNSAFSEIKDELAKADYVAGSLEVPFGGPETGPYVGYPRFNCPDALATAFAKQNIGLMFTAGTHAYDADTEGMNRTLSVLKENGVLGTGTRATAEELNYAVADVNGVKIGFINYMAGDRRSDGKIHANGTTLSQAQEACINVFTYDELDVFYEKLQRELDAMKNAGAEVLVVGIRWGTDYTTKADANQKAIAQTLCDMGVDVIAGNGAHMIQPFEALTSSVSGKTTLCMYSLGNFLSNQRKELIRYDSGHTEDGIIYTVHIRKEADGTILFGAVDYVPTWVSLTEDENGKLVYKIVPLSAGMEEKEAADSYKRTQDIVAEGVLKHNNSLLTIDDEEG